MKKSMKTMDDHQVRNISNYSPHHIHECLLFLELLVCPKWDVSLIKKQRALIFAMAFRNRLQKLQAANAKFGATWDGHADMVEHKTVARAIKMVKTLCDSLGGKRGIQQVVLSNTLLETYVAAFVFDGNVGPIRTLSSDALYSVIVAA
jgi:hypothetical protein